jgi:hypothetical protein
MTVYTFTPPTRKSRGGNPITGLFHFVSDPVGTILDAALDSRSSKDDKRNLDAQMLPFTVDDEYDTIQFQKAVVPDNPRVAPLVESRNQRADDALVLLEQSYAAGVVQPGLPKEYRRAAADVAAIGAAKLARGAPAAQPVIPATRTDLGQNFMGGFIPPGGVMGFSQMTPASQLALTKGTARRSSSGRKRRTKRAKARKARKASKTKRGKKRLVKGSAAAKRYMAKIRRKRRK